MGYGQTGMTGSDIYLCEFRYYGSPSDMFYCRDSFANQESMPLSDQVSNVVDINTTVTYDWTRKKAVL